MIEVGLGVQTDTTLSDHRRLAEAAEGHGFDVLSVYNDLAYGAPIPALLVMAGATSRVRLGPACLTPATMAPHEMASHIAALDEVSGGRAYLGIARGSWLGAVGLTGGSVEEVADAVEVVRRLLAGDDGGFEGATLRLAPGFRRRFPVTRPVVPVLVGTWGRRLAGRVAGMADEVKVGGSANPHLLPLVRGWMEASEWRGDRPVPGLVAGAVTVVDTDGAAARRLARMRVAMYVDVVGALDPTFEPDPTALDRLRRALSIGDEEAAAAAVSDEMLDHFAFAGDPSTVIAHAAAIYEAGAHRVEFGAPHGLTSAHGVDLLGRIVAPALRSAWRD